MYLSRLFKIWIPILIVLLMLLVVGTGIALAKGADTTVSTRPVTADAGNPYGGWGYCPGPCWGGWSGSNSGNYPPCHGYWQ
jgi:hypothetical protein